MTDVIEHPLPSLEPVPAEAAPVAAPAPTAAGHDETGDAAALEAGVGRSAAAGAALGFVLFTLFVGLLGAWVGLDVRGALFLGMFAGAWGGVGFGVMVGSVLAINRAEAAAR